MGLSSAPFACAAVGGARPCRIAALFAALLFVFALSPVAVHASSGVGTENYTGTAYNYSAQGSGSGITFSTDGSNMYVSSGASSNHVYQYSLGTDWNISTATYVRTYSLYTTGPNAIRFSSDGTKMYVSEFYTPDIREYTLSTPWNISTATSTYAYSLNTGNHYTFTFKSDGSELYDFNSYTNKIYEFPLGTDWDLSTATTTAAATYSMTDSYYMFGAQFSSDGSKLYINRTTSGTSYDGTIRQYNLSTPWLISTASSTGSADDLSTTGQDRDGFGLDTNPSNTDIYLVGQTAPAKVYWYSFSAPDITPPTVSLTAPATTTLMVSGSSVTLGATATDNQAVAGVMFYVDGSAVSSQVTSSTTSFTTTWNSTGVSNGTHSLIAVAEDTSGNYATSTAQSINVENGTPTSPASNVSMGNISLASSTISWTNGNGGARVVFVNASATSTMPSPSNNTTYTGSTTFGSGTQIGTTGWYAVYNGTSTSVTVSNLNYVNPYTVAVVEYDGQPGSEQYYTTGTTTNPYTKSAYAGNTIYTNYSTGNDSTGTGTSGAPYQTFTKAYAAANDGDTINLTGTFTWTNSNETGDNATYTGFTLSKPLTIIGQGAGTTTIQSASTDNTATERIFTVAASTTIENIEMRYGKIASGGGGCVSVNSGENLTLLNVDMYSCRATANAGGDLYVNASATTTIENSSIRNGVGSTYGGGAYDAGSLIVTDSTFMGNNATAAGGGGGAIIIPNGGKLWSVSSTFSNNYSYEGALLTQTGGNAYLRDSIVAGDTATVPASTELFRQSGGGTFTSGGYNIFGRYATTTTAAIASTTGDWTDPGGTGTFTEYGTSSTGALNLSATTTSATYGTYLFTPQTGSVALANGTTSAYTAGGLTVSVPTTDQVYVSRGSPPAIGAAEYEAGADTTPPTVSMTAPTASSTVSGSAVTLSANASDNVAVAGVTFYINGTKIGSQINSAPYTTTWNSTTATSTSESIVAVAVDTSGNIATSTPVSFTVDNTPPIISSIATSTTSSTATITWTTNENASSTVAYGLTTSYGSASSSPALATSHSITLTGLSASTPYHFEIYSEDAYNNIATSTDATFTTSAGADTTPPTVSVTAPTSSATVSGSSVTLSANASDNVAVGGVTFYINGVQIGSQITNSPYTTTWDSTTATSTGESIVAVAVDTSGNVATSTPVSFTVNDSAPVISAVASSTTNSTATIMWTTNENANSTLNFGTTTSYGMASTSASSVTSHSIMLSGLSASTSYHFDVVSTDTYSNTATSSDYIFTTTAAPDTTPPTVSLTSPTASSTQTGVVTLSANASDNVAVAGVTFYVDGTKQGSEITSSPYQTTWDSSATSTGTHSAFAVARDTSNNYATSTVVSFTVNATTPTPQSVTATPTASSTTITWTTPVAASSQVSFGPLSTYGSTTALMDTSPRVTSHSVTISGLPSCTLYHYAVSGTTGIGTSATSTDATFTTTGCTGGATIESTQTGAIPVSTGGSVTNGALSLTVPIGFTTATTSAIFEAHDIDSTEFFGTAGAPSGMTAAQTNVFTLKALSDATTTLSTFASPLTVTLSYTEPEIAGLVESSLEIYRYDSGTWTALDDCVVDTNAHTVTCTTSNFSDFALFGTPTPTSSGSGSTNDGFSGGGTSITQQVQNLIAMGKTQTAAAIEAQWPSLFPNIAQASTSVGVETTVGSPTASAFTRDLTLGSSGADVRTLQEFLNAHDAIIAASGAGSPGNETTYFGSLTKAALAAYQKAHGITPAAGYFGPITRTYIAAHS